MTVSRCLSLARDSDAAPAIAPPKGMARVPEGRCNGVVYKSSCDYPICIDDGKLPTVYQIPLITPTSSGVASVTHTSLRLLKKSLNRLLFLRRQTIRTRAKVAARCAAIEREVSAATLAASPLGGKIEILVYLRATVCTGFLSNRYRCHADY